MVPLENMVIPETEQGNALILDTQHPNIVHCIRIVEDFLKAVKGLPKDQVLKLSN